jgi:hypothetical protein
MYYQRGKFSATFKRKVSHKMNSSELRMKSIEHLGQVKMPLWKLAARSVFSI